jgi:hypothetical protein
MYPLLGFLVYHQKKNGSFDKKNPKRGFLLKTGRVR